MVQPTEAARKRYKLRVFFVGDDFYDKNDRISPYRSFLMFAGPDESIGALRKMVEKQFATMYPQVGFNEVSHLSDSLLSDIPEHYLVSDVFDDCRDVYAKMQGLCVPQEQPIMSPTQSRAGERPQITVGLKRKRYMPANMGSSPALIPHLDTLVLPQTSTPNNNSVARISESTPAADRKRPRVGSPERSTGRSAHISLPSSEISSINGDMGAKGRSSLTVVEAVRNKSSQASDTDAEPPTDMTAPALHENVASNRSNNTEQAANATETTVAESSDDMTEETFVAEPAPADGGKPVTARVLRSNSLSQREAVNLSPVAASSSETSSTNRRRSLDVKKKAQPIKNRRATSHAEISTTNGSKLAKVVQDGSESDSDSDFESGAKANGVASDTPKDAPPATKKSTETASAAISVTVADTENDEDDEDDSDDDDESGDEHSEADTSNLIEIEAGVSSGSEEDDDDEEEEEEEDEEDEEDRAFIDDSELYEEVEEEEPARGTRPTRSVAKRRSIKSDSDSSDDEKTGVKPDDEIVSIKDSSSSEEDDEVMAEVSEPTSPTVTADPGSTIDSVEAIPSAEQPAAADGSKAGNSSESDSSVTDSSDSDSSDTESSEDDTRRDENSKRDANQANARNRGPRFAGAGRNADTQSKLVPAAAQSPSRKRPSLAALEKTIKTPPRNGVSVGNAVGIPDTPNTMRRKRMLRQVAAAESDDGSSDSNDDSDSLPRKLASVPHLGTPAPGRKRGVMDMVTDRNSRAGKDGVHIKSISQMASAKPYDSLRKQIIKSAVKQPQETATGSVGQSGLAASAANGKKGGKDDSASESSSSDASSDSDDDDSDSDEFVHPTKRGSGRGGNAAISTPMPTRKPQNNIRFAGNSQLSNSARARRKRSSLLSL